MSLNNHYIESLISIKEDRIELRDELLDRVDNYVAVLGPPGAGKSTFCNAFYKQLFNTSNNFFEASDSNTSFTKGLWVLKEQQRQNIKINISHDIIDAEGFQVDEIKSWKYVMIISFISTDIILLNRDGRFDALKKVFGILKISFKKMNSLNIPRVLKNILIQMPTKKKRDTFQLELFYKEMNFSEEDFKGITIKPFFLPQINEEQLEDNSDILSYQHFLESINNVRQLFTPAGMVNSVSHLKNHTQNFNGALNGDISFNTQNIFKELQLDYDACYLRWEQKKIAELKQTNLTDLLSANESYEDYLKRLTIDFRFEEKLNDLTFYCDSNLFMAHYKEFHKEKSFVINDQLLKPNYDLKLAELKSKEEEIQAKLLIEQQQKETQDLLEKEALKQKQFLESEKIKRDNELKEFNEKRDAELREEQKKADALFEQHKNELQKQQQQIDADQKNIETQIQQQREANQKQLQKQKEDNEKLIQQENINHQNRQAAQQKRNEEQNQLLQKQNEEIQKQQQQQQYQQQQLRQEFINNQNRYAEEQKRIQEQNQLQKQQKEMQLEKEKQETQARIDKERKEIQDKVDAERAKLKASLELSEKASQIINYFQVKKQSIDNYFNSIKFNGFISPEHDCSINISGNDSCRREYELQLKVYYQKKIVEKKEAFKEQIQFAKWKHVVQMHGTMTCKGGCKMSSDVVCSKDEGNFYWVDGETKHVICNKCEVVKILNNLVCAGCEKEVNCELKYL